MLKPFSIRPGRLPVLLASAIVFSTATQAQVLWDESSDGDLSNNQSAPNTFTLANGANRVIGTVGGAESQDWITLTVPAGLQLSSVTLASYVSSDGQGFTGVQSGTAFVGPPDDASSYLGYAHFGTTPQNVGTDILPTMGSAPGSQGFTPPLGSGSYVFLIQQLGASTSYEFNYGVTPIPEISSPAMVAILCGAFLLRRHFAKAK